MVPADMDWYMQASIAGAFDERAASLRANMPEFINLPQLTRWHVASQDRLFHHLRTIWGNGVPRTMVDLGCHASHGVHSNISDALLWLNEFNATGGLVLAVDIYEDFALDVKRRMERVPPYDQIRSVQKLAMTAAISHVDADSVNEAGHARSATLSCAAPSQQQRDQRGLDHMCRMTRMRLGLIPPAPWLAAYPSSYDHQLLRSFVETPNHPGATHRLRYPVRRVRLDTLWRRELRRRAVDFLKVDIDSSWTALGFESMLRERAFRVMTIEVDKSWGELLPNWRVSRLDQLAWLARANGYDVFLKVACIARPGAGSVEAGRWYKGRGRHRGRWVPGKDVWAAYAWPLANRSDFVPSGYHARRAHGVQDAMLIDRAAAELRVLPALMQSDCEPDPAVAHRTATSRDQQSRRR